MAKRLKHSIVKTLPVNIIPEHIYLLDNNDGTYTQYVSDENSVLRVAKDAAGVIVVQGGDNVQVDNTDPSSPIINVDLSNYGKISVSSSDGSIEVNHVGDNYDIKAKHSVKGVVAGEGIDINNTLPETPVIGLKMKSPDGSVEISDEDGYKTLKVPVQDISGKANKDATGLTEEDKVAWKEVLGVTDVIEKDTLQTVTDRDNSTTNFIQLKREQVSDTGESSFSTLNLSIPGHYNRPNLLFTNVKIDEYLEKNTKDSWNHNTIVGYNNATQLSNSGTNNILGYNAMVNGETSTAAALKEGVDHTLKGNTFIGSYNNTKAPELYTNIVIGNYNSIFNGNYKTTPDIGYYPIWNNLLNGDTSNNAWGPLYRWDAERYKNYLKNSIELIDDEGKTGPFNNIFIGNRLRLGLTSTSCNSYQSIWIGNNVLNASFAYKFVGNIFMGNEIYPEHSHDRPAGAIVIGNYLRINGRHTLGELAIHNSTHQPTNWNDALIRGNFNTRYLKINGKFQINPNYADASVDTAFTKEVVAKVDGTLGIRDKVVPEPNLPTDIEEYDLISSQPGVINQGNPNAPVGKLMVNNKTGLGTITIDIISTQNFNSNVDLVQLPDNCNWVPLATIDNDLPVPPHTMFVSNSGTISSSLVLLKDVRAYPIGNNGPVHTYSQAIKNIYIIKNNRKIRGKVFDDIRTRTSFTTLFRKVN